MGHVTEVRGDEVTVDLPEGAVGRATTHTAHGEYHRWFENTCPILNDGSAGKPLSVCHCLVCSHDHSITQQETWSLCSNHFRPVFLLLGLEQPCSRASSLPAFVKWSGGEHISDINFVEWGKGGGGGEGFLTEGMCSTLTTSF